MIPKPIYESLPMFYVGGGIVAISAVDSVMSFLSGILLGGSGLLLMFMRRNYRVARSAFNKDDAHPASPS